MHRPGKSKKKKRSHHRICMISDFFYPNMGGVETHIWCLAMTLIERGHKVIVITHAYGDRSGIRYMTNGLKVYYLPRTVVYDHVTFPAIVSLFPLLRNILIREQISIVHGHQSTSPLAHQGIILARTMGMRACFTDHSLFGLNEVPGIHLSKLLQFTLSDIDSVICVSNTCRENLVLRACLHPSMVFTIPNAVDPTKFTPDPSKRYPTKTINIVMLSRLVYRKGIDLAVKVIPILCREFPSVYFIIGGEGPKKLLLEEMRERHNLHHRVELLGAVPHHQVRDVLVRGHIFFNCSLTESFCIALLEAASCGLFVVSCRVGGVPEVLPQSMIKFADPSVEDLVVALSDGISMARRVIPNEMHNRVMMMYSWEDVTRRTELIYNKISQHIEPSIATRLQRFYSLGPWSGWAACIAIAFLHIVWKLLEYAYPESGIEICPEYLPQLKRSAAGPTQQTTSASSGALPLHGPVDDFAERFHGRD